MIKLEDNRFFVLTKVRGTARGGVRLPGEVAKVRIDAQNVIRQMAVSPELVDEIFLIDMFINVRMEGVEMIIGVLDNKYVTLSKSYRKIKSFQITGFREQKELKYIRLGVNIQFEITEQEAKQCQQTSNNKKSALIRASL